MSSDRGRPVGGHLQPVAALQGAAASLQLLADSLEVHGLPLDAYSADLSEVLRTLGLSSSSEWEAPAPASRSAGGAAAEGISDALLEQSLLHAQQLTFTKDVYEKRLRGLERDLEQARAFSAVPAPCL